MVWFQNPSLRVDSLHGSGTKRLSNHPFEFKNPSLRVDSLQYAWSDWVPRLRRWFQNPSLRVDSLHILGLGDLASRKAGFKTLHCGSIVFTGAGMKAGDEMGGVSKPFIAGR